ncbi:Vacuolar fusion protein mon-1 [Pleurostoma richardsiae]|uniref:Vacuolar fusion protein MON1 n=1 Tax=Pleurostoma richardsiae TaxID=41990 RepID=A0AA38VL26_9PEZI|nr:Vacuolar fusion protein mon-1 [Pleurostoma richardsiae]
MVRDDGADGPNDPPGDSPPPPPLPPRRNFSPDPSSKADATKLQSKPTTAVSSVDIQTLSFPDGSRGTFSTPGSRAVSTPAQISSGYATPNLGGFVPTSSEGDDSMSVMSFAPTLRPPGDLASLVAGELNRKSRAWELLSSQSASVQPFQTIQLDSSGDLARFEQEFEEVPDVAAEETNDEERLALWRSKLKHYMILSSAGKPIWSRHGDSSLINSYMGVVQTIISFYEATKNPLQGFTAGKARFVFATEGPLYFVAISKLGESDTQLRDQLKALYMQILSTLTLPTLTKIFVHRPSTDLRTPLQGTESLLSSLADSFTKGSPSALLGALECLKLRKSQRHTINNAFLKVRTEKLLYGLIVAGGKLVSVIRPRRHSLHPSDLQLIFNMLFESGGIKAGGGENWIPLCLPAFNNSGYLYMYVSFFDGGASGADEATQPAASPEDEIAIILISPDKESFYDLKDMRDKVAQQLTRNGNLAIIKAAAKDGRPQVAAIASGSQISHFLYKSRANVQFCMAALEPSFGPSNSTEDKDEGASSTTTPSRSVDGLVARRRLMTLYHELHAAVHAKHSHLKVLHCVGQDSTSLAWITPVFEFYCVAGPNASRGVMTQGANRIIQWAKREEERLFIIGGGVF